MKSTSLFLALLALTFPTRADAFIADLFNLILNLFFGDWQVSTHTRVHAVTLRRTKQPRISHFVFLRHNSVIL